MGYKDRERQRAANKKYRLENPDKVNHKNWLHYVNNRDMIIEKARLHRIANRRELREKEKEHKRDRTEYGITYRSTHQKERAIYEAAHLPEKRARNALRRALMVGVIAGATANQLAEITEIYRRAKEDPSVRCYLCGKRISLGHRHVDHITPLSKGGKHRPSNLAVACDVCNLKKHAKTPEEIGLLF